MNGQRKQLNAAPRLILLLPLLPTTPVVLRVEGLLALADRL